MVKALDEAKPTAIAYDDPIIDYLPEYWTKGNDIDKITFEHLLTHRSGFDSGPSPTDEMPNPDWQRTDYTFMKDRVAVGVSGVGSNSGYENMNFGLCRILIPIVAGKIDKNAIFVPPVDPVWDYCCILYYREYMQDNVFGPAGVHNVGFIPDYNISNAKRALAYEPFSYEISDKKNGWDSGDLGTVSGGAGWRLSMYELMAVMDHVRRKNTIIDNSKAQFMLEHHYGIDQEDTTPAGTWYNKNGGWSSGDRAEQCVIFFLPDDMELAIFVNSPIADPDSNISLRDTVAHTYRNCLTP
jgi:CubicO group peptidase (beta-lactamase class C family)